jgi:hypothetical protein
VRIIVDEVVSTLAIAAAINARVLACFWRRGGTDWAVQGWRYEVLIAWMGNLSDGLVLLKLDGGACGGSGGGRLYRLSRWFGELIGRGVLWFRGAVLGRIVAERGIGAKMCQGRGAVELAPQTTGCLEEWEVQFQGGG